MPLPVETLMIGMVTGDLVFPEIQEIYLLHLSNRKRELTYYLFIAIEHLYETTDFHDWNPCVYIAGKITGN